MGSMLPYIAYMDPVGLECVGFYPHLRCDVIFFQFLVPMKDPGFDDDLFSSLFNPDT